MIANTHTETGIRYGVINANNISGDVLNDIMSNGVDLHYADGLEEVKADAGREWDMMDEDERAEADADDRDEHIENAIEGFNDSYESSDAPYEFDMEGVKGLYSTYSNTLMIFESPVIVKATLCSPCYPNAGDLDSTGDKAGSTWAGGPVDTYDVPADWRYVQAD
jgi:hypothetical protein